MKIDKHQTRELVLRALAAAPLAGAAAATGSSTVAGIGAGVVAAVDGLITKGQEQRRRRASMALDLAARLRDMDASDFAVHIASDDHILELTITLLEAASRATDEQHFLMLARLLADGAFAEDEATIDAHAYVARAVSGLGIGHLRALRTLYANRDPRRENLARYDEVTRGVPELLKEPIRLDLVNRNLIKGYSPNDIDGHLKVELGIPYDTPPPAAYALTGFGQEVCRRLEDAGSTLDPKTDEPAS